MILAIYHDALIMAVDSLDWNPWFKPTLLMPRCTGKPTLNYEFTIAYFTLQARNDGADRYHSLIRYRFNSRFISALDDKKSSIHLGGD